MKQYKNHYNMTFRQMRKLLSRICNLVIIKDFEHTSINEHIQKTCIKGINLDDRLIVLYGNNPLLLMVEIGGVFYMVDFGNLSSLSTDMEIVDIALRGAFNHGMETGSENVRSLLRSVIGVK